jgi:hypothetical protein
MCRLIFLEQIYRAFTIMKGEKYHKWRADCKKLGIYSQHHPPAWGSPAKENKEPRPWIVILLPMGSEKGIQELVIYGSDRTLFMREGGWIKTDGNRGWKGYSAGTSASRAMEILLLSSVKSNDLIT